MSLCITTNSKSSFVDYLVYDVTSRESFDSIENNWLKEAVEYFPDNDVVMMLVGNKIDLGNRSVTKQEGESMARKHGMMFIETSAKNRIGVQEAFEELINKVDISFYKPPPPFLLTDLLDYRLLRAPWLKKCAWKIDARKLATSARLIMTSRKIQISRAPEAAFERAIWPMTYPLKNSKMSHGCK